MLVFMFFKRDPYITYLGTCVLFYILINGIVGSDICYSQASCNPDWRRSGTQPSLATINRHFDDAGFNQLGSNSLPLQNINKGFPETTSVSAYVPCVLLKAIGAVESAQTAGAANFNGWKQFNAGYGSNGTTVVGRKGAACGYGIFQVTDGMNAGGNAFPIGTLQPERVSTQIQYNIGAGTIILINKWNQIEEAIGNNNPYIVEHWYYATWAYNSYSNVNDPNDSRFPTSRSSWRCGRSSTQNESDYPYQEKVWGCMRNPPLTSGNVLWRSVPAVLPNRSSLTFPTQTIPWDLARNYSCTKVYIPMAFK